MVIFAFVILLFSVIFVTIANQRASVLNDQLNSHLQLVSQDIASELNTAAQAGNGYTYTFQLPESGTIEYYSLNVTENGEVFVSSSIAKQVLTAVAFSLADEIASNPSFVVPSNPEMYSIPITNGTLTITNSNGNICIDYACPNLDNASGSISVSSKTYLAPAFNGNLGNINTTLTYPSNTLHENFSVSVWVYTAGPCQSSVYCGIISSNNGAYGWGLSASQTIADFWVDPSVAGTTGDMEFGIPNQKWTNIVVTYNGSGSSYLSNAYVNGVLVDANVLRSPVTLSLPHALQIGIDENNNTRVFNGSIANVQVYNSSLTSKQAATLYNNGIGGAPVSNSIIGWYPLNGNANDYTGVSSEGSVIGYVPFGSVAQVSALVKTRDGTPLSGALVGFTSSLGNFSSKGPYYSSKTNSSGIARAFLTQGKTDGYASVTATAFNGNLSNQKYLKLWVPLDANFGSKAYDISGNNNTGTIHNASWDNPSFTTQFNGYSSYVSIPSSNAQNVSYITMSAWIYLNSYLCPSDRGIILNKENSYEMGTTCSTGYLSSAISPNWAWYNSPMAIPLHTWTFVAVTWNGTHEKQYINGVLENNIVPANSNTMAHNAGCMKIGARGGCSAISSYFNGSISNVQLYNASLSSTQIMSLYKAGIGASPLVTTDIAAWYPLNGDAIDYSSYRNNGTGFYVSSSPFNPKQPVYGSMSLLTPQMNGVSKITVANNSALQPSGFVAVTLWENASVTQSSASPEYFAETPSGQNYGYLFGLHNGYLNFTVKESTNTWGSCSAQGAQYLFDGLNHMVAGIYNGSSISVYVDGQLEASHSCSDNAINYNSTSTAAIAGNFLGTLSNVQVYSSGINSKSIISEYLSGPSSFPQSQASLIGWWPLNGNTNDYSAYSDNGTATSLSYIDYNVTPKVLSNSYGSFGLNFNGANSNVSIPTSTSFAPNAFTVSAWIKWDGIRYPSSTGEDYAAVIAKGVFNSGEYTILMHRVNGSSDTTINLYINDALALSWANAEVDTQWNMVTATYNGTTAVLYYDGSEEKKRANFSTSLAYTSNPLTIGSESSGYHWGGSIADVLLYNTSLTHFQVQELYSSGMPPTQSEFIPMSWYP